MSPSRNTRSPAATGTASTAATPSSAPVILSGIAVASVSKLPAGVTAFCRARLSKIARGSMPERRELHVAELDVDALGLGRRSGRPC